ncbi:MAG: regulatory protein RecX [Acidithiobacillales bacterium]
MKRKSRRSSPEAAGPAEEALSAALRMLARRALSAGEVGSRLAAKGFAEPQAAAAVRRLAELGLVDDRTLCRQLARSYRDVRRYGARKTAGALRLRRFPPAMVDEVLREVSSPAEELAAAEAALRKRFRAGLPPGREGAAKAYRFLSGRGFDPDTCRRAIGGLPRDIEEREE